MMNFVTDNLIQYVSFNGVSGTTTLPGIFGLAMHDGIASFPALRPHQRHAWHAFLTQLGTLAVLRAGLTEPPQEEAQWLDLLRALTPSHGDAPWSLISPPDQPALLQPPLPPGTLAELKTVIECPDQLDMLVTSRNHEVKAAIMAGSQPDDWLFSLVTLQTMEGFLGAGNYGISRMNGGFSNRPAISIAPAGGPGRHLMRDIQRLLHLGGNPARSNANASPDALALTWLAPWDGITPLSWSALHPLYIEVCRRVRLSVQDGRIEARTGGSKAARIAGVPDGGVTGDPWTPIRPDKTGSKALTVDATGFSYRPLLKLLFPSDGEPAPLQQVAADDDSAGLVVLARALVRGQGKTEGLYERRVRISRKQRIGLRVTAADPDADMARTRESLAGEMAAALRFALMTLFQNGRADVDARNDASARKAKPFLDQFERAVDLTFFDDLYDEAEAGSRELGNRIRTEWVKGLFRQARQILDQAERASARATNLRFRGRVRAGDALTRTAFKKPALAPYLTETAVAP